MRKTIALCCVTALAVAGIVPAFGAVRHLLTGKDIKNGSLTGKDVRNSSLTGSDIRNGKLTGADIKRGSIPLNRLDKKTQALIRRLGGGTVPSSQAETGPTGPQGPAGAQGPQGNGQVNVLAPGNGITASNASVKFTPAGVVFGPFADNNSGGSLKVENLPAGTTLADIGDLTYTASYHHDGANDNGDAPYLRIFIDNNGDGFTGAADDHDIVFSPSTQPGACYGTGGGSSSPQCNSSDRLIKYDVTQGTVRYDDDAGAGSDSPWGAVVNDHKTDKVSSIRVTSGFSLPGTQGALLNSLTYELAGQAPATLAFGG